MNFRLGFVGCIVLSAIWVYWDARAAGVKKGLVNGAADMSPGNWARACVFYWLLAFPYYLCRRGELHRLAAVNGGDQLSGQAAPEPAYEQPVSVAA